MGATWEDTRCTREDLGWGEGREDSGIVGEVVRSPIARDPGSTRQLGSPGPAPDPGVDPAHRSGEGAIFTVAAWRAAGGVEPVWTLTELG